MYVGCCVSVGGGKFKTPPHSSPSLPLGEYFLNAQEPGGECITTYLSLLRPHLLCTLSSPGNHRPSAEWEMTHSLPHLLPSNTLRPGGDSIPIRPFCYLKQWCMATSLLLLSTLSVVVGGCDYKVSVS